MKPEQTQVQQEQTQRVEENKPYTPEALQQAWNEYADQRKTFQAEYHLLTQPYEKRGDEIIVHLHSPIEETMLNSIKSELTTFIRQKLQNYTIVVTGELKEEEARKMIYTNREKFDYLVERNPMLKELKDRLGLDTDF